MTDAVVSDLLDTWNDRSAPPVVYTVDAMLGRSIADHGDRTALVDGHLRLTYSELGALVAQLANRLQAGDPAPEDVIAIGVPRSAEMVIGVLAVMVAGCAFVPVDPSWPAARRAQVLRDSQATRALVEPAGGEGWPVPTLEVSLSEWGFGSESTVPPAVDIAGARLAYVIFTSGSTGTPKGAMIRHEAICERLRWQRDVILGFGPDDASLFKAPLAFDIAINEILLPLVSGGRVVVAEPDGEKDPEYLLDLIESEGVTYVYLVSSMLDALLQLDALTPDASSLAGLRHVWCGGEVLTPDLFRRFREQLTTTLYHGYGPAEATIGVSHVIYRDVAERIATSIGAPNPHTQLYVLDENLDPVPPGVGGELYAAGFLLGRGYVNAPSLTGSRFVANPFDPDGSRMYRTGDLARWTPEGSLEFLGRSDNQVKIRGRRIELEEIEAALAEHPAVRAAVVTVRERPSATLVAYVTAAGGVSTHDLLRWAGETVPDYMVPSEITILDRMPVTANGKADRVALTRRTAENAAAPARSGTVTPPTSPREVALCAVFADVLDLDDSTAAAWPDIDADFFALGGDSIVAIRVVSRLRAHGYTLRPRDMFAHRTVRALAPALADVASLTPRTDVDAAGSIGPTPITAWLDEIGRTPDGAHRAMDGFHQGMVLVTPTDLTGRALTSILDAVCVRHEMLRARTDGPAADLVVDAGVRGAAVLLTVVDGEGDDLDVEYRAAVGRLDPSAGRMVVFSWLRGARRLLVVAHHTVVDGISLRIIAEDIAAAHRMLLDRELLDPGAVERGAVERGAIELDPVPVSFRGWAHAVREVTGDGAFDGDLSHWLATVGTPDTPLGDRILDPAIDTVATEARLRVEIPTAVTSRLLTEVPDAIHGRVDDAMVTALALAVARWRVERGLGDPDDVVLELEGHGREGEVAGDADISRTVGWFTTLYPVALRVRDTDEILSDPARLGALTRSVKEQLRATPSHGLSYGALRFLAGHDDLAVAPQVLFNYLGRFSVTGTGRPWSMVSSGGSAMSGAAVLEGRGATMPLPRLIEVNAETADTADGPVLTAVVSWPAHAVGADAVERLADLWVQGLTAIAACDDLAGHTPSDFPLVTATQDDIAEIESHTGDLDTLLPLTSVQEGIWFHSTFSDTHDPYVVQQIVAVDGDIDHRRFEDAAAAVVARHQALGAGFRTLADGTPVAVHGPVTAPEVRWIDGDDATVDAVARAERDRRFDLAAPPLMRFTLVRHTPDGDVSPRHSMIQTVHHIIADGWSVPIVLNDLAAAYRGDLTTAPAPRFDDHLRWLADRDVAADRAAWADYLHGVDEPTRVAVADGPIRLGSRPPRGGESRHGRRRRAIAASVRTAVADFARAQSVTEGAVVTSLWGVVLARITGRDDVVFGTAVSGRGGDLPGIDATVGLLINTVATRVRRARGATLTDTVRAGAVADLAVLDHQHIPLSEIADLTGSAEGAELFDTLLVVENLAAPAADHGGGLAFGPVDVVEAPHYPVTIMVSLHDDIVVTMTNDRSVISDEFTDILIDTYLGLLDEVAGAHRARPSATPVHAIETRTVDELLADAARTHPDATAVVFGDTATTFAELAAASAAVAGRLADAGVGRGDVVALLAERSVDAVAGLWAIIACGAAYLPIDPSHPAARIRHMLDTAAPVCVLLDAHRSDLDVGVATITLGGAQAGAAMPEPCVTGADAVSVVFTSGSTGVPRAVVGTHAALANRLGWAAREWSGDIRLAKSSLSFVDGTTELLGALVAGATVVLADDRDSRDGAALARLVATGGVDQVLAVPSLARAMAEEFGDAVSGVRRWILSGEALDSTTVASLQAVTPEATVVNSYGSSEVAGDVLADHAVDGGAAVSLGTAVPGTDVVVVGTELVELPHGVIGEIAVGGVQLARGYLGAATATATRFVADPRPGAVPGSRLYRTGDLGWVTADGAVHFVGRTDDQVSVNGFRIEPREIEAAVVSLPGVSEAAVVTRRSTPVAGGASTPELIAAVVPTHPGLAARDVLTALADRLPRHMIPTAVVHVEAIPLLPNGKRNRAAVLDAIGAAPAVHGEFVAPSGDVERAVVDVMAEVLGVDELSADADFFRQGGDSILAIRLTGRLARLGHHVTGEDVFRGRTAIGIAARAGATDAPSRDPVERFGTVRLTPAEIDAAVAGSPGAVEDIWAMTPLQQGVYVQCVRSDADGPDGRHDDSATTYIAQNVFTVDRRLDIVALRRAVDQLLRRHPQLRAGFRTLEVTDPDSTPMVAVIAGDPVGDVAAYDLTETPDAGARFDRIVAADRSTPFDLAAPPLIRVTVVGMPDGTDRLLVTYHFLLFDGWSRELLLRDLFALYDAARTTDPDGADPAGVVPGRPAPFTDYLRWLSDTETELSQRVWSDVLADIAAPTLVAGTPSNTDVETSAPVHLHSELSEELTAAVRATADRLGVTDNAVLTTALAVVTGFHAGTSDVVLGTTVAGRPGEIVGIEDTIGLFLNTVPERVDLAPSRTVAEVITGVADQRIHTMPHDHVGLGELQRVAGHAPLFDSLFVLQNFLDDDTFADLELSQGITDVRYSDTTHFPLTWVLTPGATMGVKLEYRPDAVGAGLAESMPGRFVTVLTQIVADTDRPVGSVAVHDTADRAALEARWAATTHAFEPLTVAELLAAQTADRGDAVALVFGDERVSYRELDARVNRMARLLLAHGAAPERIVALDLPRSIDMVVALFAVLRSGAAYLPLERDHPVERLTAIVDDASPAILLTDIGGTELSSAADRHGCAVVVLTDPQVADTLASLPAHAPTVEELGSFATGSRRLQHPAYLIYTSGSTGKPKGVVTPYIGLTNMFHNHATAIFEPTVARADRGPGVSLAVAHTVSFSFDMSWEELFWLVAGHEVHVCDEELRRDAVGLVEYCRTHVVDVINVTPTYAHHLVDAGLLDPGRHNPALVLLGGEAVTDTVWSRLTQAPGVEGYNLYGPTEYTINTLGAGTADSATPTVGQAIWNTRGYVLDTSLRPVPDGVVGELYIAGVGLARGYHRRPELTAGAMVADPFVPGGRMYRTGDLVRRRLDGNLDYLGRSDDQIKIRGYRVELGEIESRLADLDDVARCAVIARSDPTVPGVKTLVAYVIPTAPVQDPAGLVVDVRDRLAAVLPAYMIPTRFGVVDELPLTVNGKLDVAALPEPVAATRTDARAPRSERERIVAELCQTVLGIDRVGIDDDFFALGGDSISSISLSSRAAARGLRISSRDVFRRRTVLAIAAAATEIAGSRDTEDVGVGTVPATPMLAETRSAGTSLDGFHQSMVLRTPIGMTRDQLVAVLDALIVRHELLRAEVVGNSRPTGGWDLVVPAEVTPRDRYRLDVVAADFTGGRLDQNIAERAAKLDARGGVMLTAAWHPGGAGAPGQLLLVIHHLVVDGVSWRIVIDHLAQAWARVRSDRDPRIEAVGTSFRRWAHLLTGELGGGARSAEIDHWVRVLAQVPAIGDRPLDPHVDTAATTRTITVDLPADVTAAISGRVPAAIHGGVDEILLAGLSLATRAWRSARRPDTAPSGRLLLNLEGHGRRPEVLGTAGDGVGLAETVGWFTAIHPVAIDAGDVSWDDVVTGATALDAAVKAVKEQVRSTPTAGIGYGVLRHVDRVPELVDLPVPEILFNYLGRFDTPAVHGPDAPDWSPVPGLGELREGVDPTNPAAALEINARIDGAGDHGRFVAEITWPTGILDDVAVTDLADRWMAALTGVTRAPLGGHTPSDFPLVDLTVDDVAALTPVDRPVDDVLPLLPLQAGMYFHSLLLAGDRADGMSTTDPYVVQQVAALSGRIDLDRFVDALDSVVARHAALRARFATTVSGALVQVIETHRTVEVDRVDLRSEADPDRAADAYARQAQAHPFDLDGAPPIRFAVVTTADDRHRLVQTMHHALADGWSYPLMFADLMRAYRFGTSTLPPVTVDLADHIGAVRGVDVADARAVWTDALSSVAGPTLVAQSMPPVVTASTGHRDVSTSLTPAATEALVSAARARGVTVGAVVHAAWALVLGRITATDSVVFGSTVSGRAGTDPDVTGVVGLLINTNPLAVAWSPSDPLARVVDSVAEFQLAVMDAQQLGLTEIARLTGHPTLFDTMVVVENFPDIVDGDGDGVGPDDLTVTGFTGTDTPHYPVSLVAFPGESLSLEIKYDSGLVPEEFARGLTRAVSAVIEQWTTALERTVAATALGNTPRRVSPGVTTDRRTLVDAFADSVGRDPSAVAVTHDGRSLTYQALDERSNALARVLIDAGARPERRVGVGLPRGIDLVVAVVAVVKTGAAYVPLDVASPPERLRYIAGDAAVTSLVTCETLADAVPVDDRTTTVRIDDPADRSRIDSASTAPIIHTDRPQPPVSGNPAYLIYTSGSTGEPKAVEMPHSSLLELFTAAASVMPVDERVWTMFHSIAFDFSVWELWGALLHGGRLVVVDAETCRDPERFVALLARERVTVLSQTPSAYYPLLEQSGFDDLGLETVVFGGEALDLGRVAGRGSARLINMYGITETCVHVTQHDVAPDSDASGPSVVGRPLPSLEVALLDHHLQPVADGLVGEIYVAGTQLARGYAGRPDLTATRFVATTSGRRMYRSGDLAHRDPSGALVYLGRADQQVALRGFRIELGEVEHALRRVTGVSDAAAAVGADRTGRAVLAAVLVGSVSGIDDLRTAVARHLPDYMIPARMVTATALPLTVNGKIDRAAVVAAAVAEPEKDSATTAGATSASVPVTAPVTAATADAAGVAAVVGDLIGREDVGVDDDFFTLGGDSIVAISLVNRLKSVGLRITPRDVFTHRTARRLAEVGGAVSAVTVTPARAVVGAHDVDRYGDVLLTPIVHRLSELGGTIDRLNQAEIVCTPAGADESQIHSLLTALVHRHDALRQRLTRTSPLLWSIEVDPPTVTPEVVLHSVNGVGLDDHALSTLIGTESDALTATLDPDAGRMLAAAWIDAGPIDRGRLILVAHHLAVDAVSWRILIDDLSSGWNDVVAGRGPDLPPATTSLRAHATALTQRAAHPVLLGEFEFWHDAVRPGADLVEGATTFGLTVGQTVERIITIDTDLTRRLLTTIPAVWDADVTETLVTSLAVALGRLRGTSGELLIDLERHGRDLDPDAFGSDAMDLTRTCGWFTTVAPVRLPAMTDDVAESIPLTRDALRAVPDGGVGARGIGFGLLRHCNPRTAGLLARGCAPQVLFNYLGRTSEGLDRDWSPADSSALRTAPNLDLGTLYLLEVNVVCIDGPAGPTLQIHLIHPADGIPGLDVDRLGDDWTAVVRDLDSRTDSDSRTERDTARGERSGPGSMLSLSTSDRASLADRYGPALSDVWPLSPLQQGLYFQATSTDVDVYLACTAFDIDDRLDADAICAAMGDVLTEHRAMRSGFVTTPDGHLVTAVVDDLVVPLHEIDLTDVAEAVLPERLQQITDDDRALPFDLTAPPLVRLTVVRLPEGRSRLLLTYHLLLWDGWSRELVLDAFFGAYDRRTGRATAAADDETATPRADFTDYLRWIDEQDSAASAQAWRDHLAGLEEPSILFPDALGTEPVLARRTDVEFTEVETEQLGAAARRAGVTVHAVISASLALLLSRRLGRSDVVFGTTVAGRPTDLDGIDEVVGVFLNTVPVRVAMGASDTVADVMRRIQDDRVVMMEHEYLGLGEVQRHAAGVLGGEQGSDGGALFDSLYVLQNFLDDDTFNDLERSQRITGVDAVDATHYPLTWVAMPGARLWLKLEYRPDVVDESVARDLLAELRTILLTASADHDRAVAAVTTTPVAEIAGRTVPVDDVTIAEMLVHQAVATPDRAAVSYGAETLTYRVLAERVNRTARLLLDHGAGPEQIVGLALPRSIDMVVGLFAVLSVGAAYLPLDLSAPDDRIADLVDDAAPLVVLVNRSTVERITGLNDRSVTTVPIEDAHSRSDSPLGAGELGLFAPGNPGRLDHPAYVIYTSGSTGRPKGVVTGYRGLTNMQINHRAEIFAPVIDRAESTSGTGEVTLTIAHTVSFAFDMSWEELLWLVEGHHVHVCDEDLRRDATALVQYCREHRIDVINVTPTYATQLVEQGLLAGDTAPRLVLLGGEAVSDQLWATLRDTPDLLAYNLYGPTEYTINTLGVGSDDSDRSAVGLPIANTTCHILDPWMRPVPNGVAGELYISGAGLARCYLRRPDLTAGAFVADIGGGGDRMYRTGDVVRGRPDGLIDYLGRSDDQVKIRGHRVEPGEVAAVMLSLAGVVGGSVIAAPDGAGGKRLVAYVIGADHRGAEDRDPDDVLAEVRSGLAAALPGYLVPAAYALVDELPLTTNGKLDTAALPEPSVISTRSRAAANDTEQTMCELFAAVVGVPAVGVPGTAVGVSDDFFALGGHSLLATRLVGLVNDRFGTALRVRDLFDAPSPEALSRRVSDVDVSAAAGPVLAARPDGGPAPLAPPQQQLWVMSRIDPDSTSYLYPVAVRVRGPVDADHFRSALGAVLARHEPLRTLHVEADGHPVRQVLEPAAALEQLTLDVRVADPADIESVIDADLARPLDPARDLPIRATLLDVDGDTVVLLTLHHLVADEWSDGVLLDDLDRAYSAGRSGRDPVAELGTPDIAYGDYARWAWERLGDRDDPQSAHGRQIAYWREQLAGLPPEVTIAPDTVVERPGTATSVAATIDGAVADRLRTVAGDHAATMFMAVHAALVVVMRRFGAGDDIVIGSPQSGRTESALAPLVGFFANTVVLRTDLSGRPTFGQLLHRIRATDLAALDHADVPFADVVGALNPTRSPGRNPLFAVLLGYFRRDPGANHLFGAGVDDIDATPAQAKVDLNVTCVDHGPGAGMELVIERDSARYRESTIRQVLDHLTAVLDRLADAPDAPIVETAGLRTLPRSDRVPTPARWFEEFDAHAAEHPEVSAVICGGRSVSYGALAQRSRELATRLRDSGVGPESVVALALDRSSDLVAAMMAVHRVQAAYLPLDLALPVDRLVFIVDDAAPTVVVTDGHADLSWATVPVWDLNAPEQVVAEPVPSVSVDTADLAAYLIYTSGSTGAPKGVTITHRALDTFRTGLRDRMPVGSADAVLALTTVSFDIAVLELLVPLTRGATVVLAGSTESADPGRLGDLIAAHGVTVAQATPSLWSMIVRHRDADGRTLDLSGLRIAVGGEALPAELATELVARSASVTNMYGPTEVTVWATSAVIDTDTVARPPIGSAWDTVTAYVLDADLVPVPPGVVGELYLSGAQVARGYHHRFGLTADRFVADPFVGAGARMYRTGDVVRLRADGTLDYRGRSDHQIKIRGHRVEPDEVGAALRRIEGVADAVVIADVDETLGTRLVGYVVATAREPVSGRADLAASARRALASSLPAHMVPALVVVLDALPLTPNGKVDRKALPRPVGPASAASAPADTDVRLDATERAVAEVFGDVLGSPVTRSDADFFALGGHSLLLVRLADALEARFDRHVEVRELFGRSTVAAVAARIDGDSGPAGHGEADALDPVIRWGADIGPDGPTPVVCLPPASGLCWEYGGLARALGPATPVVGLQSRSLSDPSAVGRPFAAVVTDWCDRIDGLGVGPRIRLVGWSFGGILAVAIADELYRRGHTVDPLVVLDAYRPDGSAAPGSDHLAVLLRELGVTPPTDAPVTMDDAVRLLAASDDVLAALGDTAVRSVITTYLDSDRILAEAAIESTRHPVVFVQSTVGEPGFGGGSAAGWSATLPAMRVVDVPVEHSAMLSPRALETVVGLLQE